MSLEEASGLYITWPTSYAALKYRGRLQPDEWCLVHAGAGGVGLAAIQLAKAMGAKVIATAGSEESELRGRLIFFGLVICSFSVI